MDSPSELTAGAIFSFLLLTTFVVLNYFFEGLLSLQTQWIALAVVPLIIALFVGDYITYFKGFGIELKSRLDDPISTYTIPLKESSVAEIPGEDKESVEYIENLSQERKNKIKRITFIEGKEQYYDVGAIQNYFNEFPNLKYVEVVDSSKRFLCLIPIESFQENGNFDYEKIDRLKQSIEEGDILEVYSDVAISDTVDSGQSLISVLSQIRSSSFDTAPVLDREERLIGIIDKKDIEKKISDAVLSLHNRRGR